MWTRHRHSKQATKDIDKADKVDADTDADRADDVGKGTIDANGAANNLAQA